jgi:hypothetical protein
MLPWNVAPNVARDGAGLQPNCTMMAFGMHRICEGESHRHIARVPAATSGGKAAARRWPTACEIVAGRTVLQTRMERGMLAGRRGCGQEGGGRCRDAGGPLLHGLISKATAGYKG